MFDKDFEWASPEPPVKNTNQEWLKAFEILAEVDSKILKEFRYYGADFLFDYKGQPYRVGKKGVSTELAKQLLVDEGFWSVATTLGRYLPEEWEQFKNEYLRRGE